MFAQTPKVADPNTQRAFDVVQQAVLDLQARRHLEEFTATEPGYVPESGGEAFDFLAADGTWKTVAGAGTVDSVTAGSAMVSVTPTTGNVVVDVMPANFTGIPESGVTGLVADLAGKAATVHAHAEADVTGLVADLAARPTGSGTANTVPKWTATAVLGNSSITDTGSLISTSTPVTLGGALTLSTMTLGSVFFAGAGGLVSQKNAKFFWDNTNDRLGIGTSSPVVTLNIVNSATTLTSIMRVQSLNPSGNSSCDFFDEGGTSRFGIGYDNLPDRAQLSMNNSTPFVIVDGSIGQTVKFFNNGRVNIGSTTSDPAVLLRVEGTAAITGNTQLGGTSQGVGIRIAADSNHPLTFSAVTGNKIALYPINSTSAFGFGVQAGQFQYYVDGSGNKHSFGYGDSDAFTEVAFINGSGNAQFNGTLSATGNFAINTNKFTVAASSGNTVVAGTLGVTGLSTLTGGFTLGAASSAGSFKITSLANGTVSTDAAAFGQIATAVTAAVSGTTNTLAKFTSANAVGNSSITDTGALVTVVNPLVVNGSVTVNPPAAGGSGTAGLLVNNANTGQTATNGAAVAGYQSGTHNTTGAAVFIAAVDAEAFGTRSAGSNNLTNTGLYAYAGGGQINYAIYAADGGDVALCGASDVLTVGGAATFSEALTATGDVALGDGATSVIILDSGASGITLSVGSTVKVAIGSTIALNDDVTVCDTAGRTLAFHGAAGAAQQTVSGSRGGNAALADLLTKLATLGLIVNGTSA